MRTYQLRIFKITRLRINLLLGLKGWLGWCQLKLAERALRARDSCTCPVFRTRHKVGVIPVLPLVKLRQSCSVTCPGASKWQAQGPNPGLPQARTCAFSTSRTIPGIPLALCKYSGHLYSTVLVCSRRCSNGQVNIPFALDGLI